MGADLHRIWDYMARWLCCCRSGLRDHAHAFSVHPTPCYAEALRPERRETTAIMPNVMISIVEGSGAVNADEIA